MNVKHIINKFVKKEIARSFSDAAKVYEQHAVLQREIALRLVEKLDYIRCEPKVIIDAGSGTGYCTRALSKKFPKARITGIDLAEGMVAFSKTKKPWLSKQKYIQSDMLELPFEDNSVDFIFSNLALQWITDMGVCFQEWQRVLKPGGLLLFSTFGPDTLKELKSSWAQADEGVHVNQFTDLHDVGDALVGAHLADPVMDAEIITTTYRDVKQLMYELKAIGAHNVDAERPKGLTGKGTLKKMMLAYEQFRNQQGWIPATWEVVYGHAWGTDYQGPKMKNKETFVLDTSLGKPAK